MSLHSYRNSDEYIDKLNSGGILVLTHPMSTGAMLFLHLDDIEKYIKRREKDWKHKKVDMEKFRVDVANIEDKDLKNVFEENFAEHCI